LRRLGLSFVVLAFLITSPKIAAQGHPEEAEVRGSVVELWATVAESSPCVTLHWSPSYHPSTGITVYRRISGESNWGSGASLLPSALSYTDMTAMANTLYEYRVVRTQSSAGNPVAEGHLWSGVNVPVVEDRGRVILVVDDTMSSPLAVELDRLIADLIGDGWAVVRTDVSRTGSPQQVWDAIHGWYSVEPLKTRAVFLLGRVPVPYSGDVCPDGHDEAPPEAHHRGAWPTDVFYGDMNGVWTDTSVSHALANVDGARHHNLPDDGKFDQSLITGEHLPELVVGRVDLSNLGGIANGVSETELLRRYLDRHHAFRHRLAPFGTLGERAMIDDNFGNAFDLGFAASGWASGISLFGNANTSAQDWVPTLSGNDYLLAYGCGSGAPSGASGVSTIANFRDTPCRAVFNLLFGSFFGDWDWTDNYLRAPLVGREDSHGLVSLWSSNPRWQLFPLAAGGTLADAYQHLIREVNQPLGPFPPAEASWTNPDQIHVAIMGDPVLRSHPAKPVTDLIASVNGDQVTLTWTNPVGESHPLGCHVYRSDSWKGIFERVGSRTFSGATSFVDTVPSEGDWHYLVRFIKLQSTASASYENPAQGTAVHANVPAFGYALWAAGLFEDSPTADSNGDGVPNLLAYAVGAQNGEARAVMDVPRANGDRSFIVPQSSRSDIRYQIELSPDLETWFSVAIRPIGGTWALNGASGYPNQGNVTLSGGSTKIFSDSTLAERCFWRVRVSL